MVWPGARVGKREGLDQVARLRSVVRIDLADLDFVHVVVSEVVDLRLANQSVVGAAFKNDAGPCGG